MQLFGIHFFFTQTVPAIQFITCISLLLAKMFIFARPIGHSLAYIMRQITERLELFGGNVYMNKNEYTSERTDK